MATKQDWLLNTLSVMTRAFQEKPNKIAKPPAHPLTPAAVRIERSQFGNKTEKGTQNAITLWFGEGPALPSPSTQRSPMKIAMQLSAGLLGAAALAATAQMATRLETSKPRTLLVEPTTPDEINEPVD